jgi:4-amino-4-deoxy-L-arabinose transferase-like glycosyltransferase
MMTNFELGLATQAYVKQAFGEDQIGVDYYVTLDSGLYVIVWDREEPVPTDEQLEAAFVIWNWDAVRTQRNELLAETDFYALTDVPMSADMTTYRQALRDVPASVENSEDVVWPEKPV